MTDGTRSDYPPIDSSKLPPCPQPPPNPLKNRLRWRIYYRDGHTVDSTQATWMDAPREHLVAVVWQAGDGPVKVEVGTPYYLHMGDWICRVWDPTLYLRKKGVRCGRWAENHLFQDVWRTCLSVVTGKEVAPDSQSLQGGLVCASQAAEQTDPRFAFTVYYDDGTVYTGSSLEEWNNTPTDGVLAVGYHHVLNGIKIAFASRRFTFYYWRDMELVNLDFVDEIMPDFPQFKYGCPSFTGKSYTEQAKAIAHAMADTLDDVK